MISSLFITFVVDCLSGWVIFRIEISKAAPLQLFAPCCCVYGLSICLFLMYSF